MRVARLTSVVLVLLVGACGAAAPPPESKAPRAPESRLEAPPPAPAAPAPAAPAAPGTPFPSLTGLVEAVKAAVVNVEVTARARRPALPFFGPDPGDEFWRRFFGPESPRSRGRPREQIRQGIGSGFIVSPEGQVLTNNHVVDGAVSIRVKLDDGRSFEAKVVGRDPLTDVAVLQLQGEPRGLPVVKLGDSDALKVGEWVVAIGNPFGLASSVSAGIVSARARNIGAGPYDDFLQTDAAINPGNSGGPLFNLKGEVVGINTAIVGGGSGIGFAVPSNLVKALLPQLEQEGSVTRGWLGLAIQDATAPLARALGVPVAEGALVTDVTPDAPAEKAGLKPDDVVVAIDGAKVTSAGDLSRKVALQRPGTQVTLTVYRGGKKDERKVTLGTRPDLEGVAVEEGRGDEADARQQKLGLSIADADPALTGRRGSTGALIAEVQPGSEADRAELRPGMVVVEAAGKAIRSAAELRRVLADARAGETVLLRVQLGEGKVLRALTIPD